MCAGTLRPHGRQTNAAGEQAGASAAAAGTGWQPPPIVFQGADDTDIPSTPTRVKQLLKRGVVKFKEVSFSSARAVIAQTQCPHGLPTSDAYNTGLGSITSTSTVHTSCILCTCCILLTLHAPRIHLSRQTAYSSGHETRTEYTNRLLPQAMMEVLCCRLRCQLCPWLSHLPWAPPAQPRNPCCMREPPPAGSPWLALGPLCPGGGAAMRTQTQGLCQNLSGTPAAELICRS